MPHTPNLPRILAGAAALVAAFALVACNGDTSALPATVTPPTATEPPAAATPATPPPTETPSPATTPESTPEPAPTPEGQPAGYAESCAAGFPWGQQVRNVLLCLEGPGAGSAVSAGEVVEVSGYAGGSFENNVVVELHDAEGEVIFQQPVTYAPPDLGMPGAWSVEVTIPADAEAGPMRVVAYFASPRDGGMQALTSAELRVE